MLTNDQRMRYLMHGGGQCPKCGGGAFDGGPYDYCGDTVSQKVSCTDCDAEWIDTYTLSSVTGEDGDDEMATAKDLRTATDNLLSVFDSMSDAGIDWESEPFIAQARAALAKGFDPPARETKTPNE